MASRLGHDARGGTWKRFLSIAFTANFTGIPCTRAREDDGDHRGHRRDASDATRTANSVTDDGSSCRRVGCTFTLEACGSDFHGAAGLPI
jgi:hypothetical protein